MHVCRETAGFSGSWQALSFPFSWSHFLWLTFDPVIGRLSLNLEDFASIRFPWRLYVSWITPLKKRMRHMKSSWASPVPTCDIFRGSGGWGRTSTSFAMEGKPLIWKMSCHANSLSCLSIYRRYGSLNHLDKKKMWHLYRYTSQNKSKPNKNRS